MSRAHTRRPGRLGMAIVGLMAVMTALALVPAVASAKSVKPSLEIGPFKAAKGYAFDLVVGTCAGASTDVTIDYSKGKPADNIDYSYAGKGSCTASGNLKKASLHVSWPGIATINLSSHGAGRLVKAKALKGCTGGKGGTRVDVLRGSISVSAAKVFGTLKSRHIKAAVSKISNVRCRATKVPKSTNFFGEFGQNAFISANVATKKVRGEVFISDQFAPATGVTGSMYLNLIASKKTFNLNKGTAKLTRVKPFASGTLTMTELPACSGSSPAAHNVTLAGAITIKSPVLGTLSYGTSNATSAYINTGSAFPGQCNGYGSQPFTASITNSCSNPAAPCSVADGENDVFIEDNSTLGTQTVVSESVNFGDGSAPVSVMNGDIPDHTYAAPGTFTATVTFQTSDGNTETASTPVYITS